MPPRPLLRAGVLAAVLAIGACTDPTGTGTRETIAPADFPRAAVGGDPRGFYETNSPLLWLFDLPGDARVRFTTNGRPGWIRFEGSASQGTYGSFIDDMRAAGTMDDRGASSPFVLGSDWDGQPLHEGYGQWRTLGGGRLELDAGGMSVDTVAYTVTSRGIFFISREALSENATATAVLAFIRR